MFLRLHSFVCFQLALGITDWKTVLNPGLEELISENEDLFTSSEHYLIEAVTARTPLTNFNPPCFPWRPLALAYVFLVCNFICVSIIG